MKNKIIIIIGARGSLGQALCSVFPQAIGWDRDDIDVTDKKQVDKKIAKLKPAVVINAAAYNAVDECEKSVAANKLAENINGYAVGFLAQACRRADATLVHYSTNYVFDGEKKAGYTESDRPNPVNAYGLSKLLGERKIVEVKNLRYYIIRTSKLFGHKGSSELAKKNFFDLMRELANKKSELRVVDDELSNFTYTPDLAGATKELLDGNFAVGIYHIVNEQPATWYEAARALFDITKKNVTVVPVSAAEFKRPAKRPKYGILLNTKLPKLRSYQEALQEFLISN